VPSAVEAVEGFIACIERYTAQEGFYVSAMSADGCTIVDLSDEERTIVLHGTISDVMKATLANAWAGLKDK